MIDRRVLILQHGFRPSKGGIDVGDDVWIGAQCVLLDGADVGEGCVMEAGCVMCGGLNPYGVYGGQPLEERGQRR